MASPNEALTYHADIPLSEDLLNALVDQQRVRKLPTLGKTIAVLLGDTLGKPTGPMWNATEIVALREGPKRILKTLAHATGGLTPTELANEAETGAGTKAFLAHLTMHYRGGKEPLHQWDESTQKYIINPKYREIVLAALP